MEFKDYYKILGVDPDADEKAIKIAYRKLARQYHPDVSDHHDAENRFKDIAEAYEVLKDREKRAEYDELRRYGRQQDRRPPPGGGGYGGGYGGAAGGQEYTQADFSDFFSSIFGSAGGAQRGGFGAHQPFENRGQDVETELPVFLEDTLAQSTKTISYHLPRYNRDGSVSEAQKTLNVTVPAGVTEGERIRLKGQGAPGIGGGPSGDLYLRVRLVPHPLFDVEGHNLVMTLPIAPWEAALGAKVTLPTLSGKIELTVPPNSQSGQRFRVKGKGLPGKSIQGDLYAVLKIVMPPKNDESAKAQWKKLAELAPFNPRAEWSNAS